MAKLKKLVEPKGAMEIAYEKEKKTCQALGEPFHEENFNVADAGEETLEEKLSKLVLSYEANKSQMDIYKKKADSENAKIKKIMEENGLSEYVVGSTKVTYSTSTKQSFIEDALIAKIKELKVKGIVKKKEYVDMDALESAIYNGQINAAELSTCQETKTTVSLRLSKVKG